MDPITIQFPIIPAADDGGETATDLNDDVIEEILSWVPAKSVIYWKSVCKDWQSMLDNPVFARTHFSRATLCPLLITGGKAVCRPGRIMHLVEGLSVSDLDARSCVSKVISRFDIRTRTATEQPEFKDVLSGLNTNATSCEGLLCWTAYDQNRGECIIISNPITGEYVSLSSDMDDEDKTYVFVGMGFRRETKKFELLRMSSERDIDDVGDPLWWAEVCVVGDSSWRPVGGGTPLLLPVSQVVYVDGSIYWSYADTLVICCFNLDTRAVFEVAQLPDEIIFPLNLGSLGVLDGALCLSRISPRDGHVEVLVLVDDAATSALQWKKLYDVDTMTTQLDHMGVLWPRGQYKVIKRLSRGEILMHDCRGTFIIYDPVTKEEIHVCLLEDSRLARDDGLNDLQVVSHVPRLVELKKALNVVDGLQCKCRYGSCDLCSFC